ncbi:MAG: LPS export ABC transporter periplasmic protein LptC [Bacteroidales bacterium]|nr:LPS export ABC transporter periplasmic protein LptC [Bacteroidales bacterium]
MLRGFPNIRFVYMVVIALAVTTFVISCKGEERTDPIDLSKVPVQSVENMNAVQTKDGLLQMRMEAKLLQRFKNDDQSYELFPDGFDVYAYNEEGALETHIKSDMAKHTTTGEGNKKVEKWEAFGNVVISNFIKGERLETDTLYWDREKGRIYTHCFVKMFTPQGFMQGYELESDERARNANILRPFDSYGIISNDSTDIYIDTVNFIGPQRK